MERATFGERNPWNKPKLLLGGEPNATDMQRFLVTGYLKDPSIARVSTGLVKRADGTAASPQSA